MITAVLQFTLLPLNPRLADRAAAALDDYLSNVPDLVGAAAYIRRTMYPEGLVLELIAAMTVSDRDTLGCLMKGTYVLRSGVVEHNLMDAFQPGVTVTTRV